MPLDDDQSTLHIRCGSDLRLSLQTAGFAGDFLEYADPVCQGPVPPSDEELLTVRAEFINRAYEADTPEGFEETLELLQTWETTLAGAASHYDRVVLWFEHDSFDQLILCRILNHFHTHDLPGCLEMVTTDHYPGYERFIGLGQLNSAALRDLWQRRLSVTPEQIRLGARCWQALREPSPASLAALMTEPTTDALPYLAGALHRHLQELPSASNGLGLTEQLTLEQLRAGSHTVAELFRALIMTLDPRPWLGDLMFWFVVESLLSADNPPIAITANTDHASWPHHQLRLTETGLALLDGELDWMQCAPPDRWLGGTKLGHQQPDWRWDDAGQCLKLS
ncbi:MAG: DUF1835 domain-containing protein [Marinobacter sp.]|uniref:DUF1835 domain-containing protein n=1 Tax=Marinobacter sp. TaxID=50741 RepID=UPI00299D5260|nr:DUF1835 domain-containing protein [Marinobacter sp.]MDX1756075.1 DUF1835 domain-containing protein [Marinobacter sp.]